MKQSKVEKDDFVDFKQKIEANLHEKIELGNGLFMAKFKAL